MDTYENSVTKHINKYQNLSCTSSGIVSRKLGEKLESLNKFGATVIYDLNVTKLKLLIQNHFTFILFLYNQISSPTKSRYDVHNMHIRRLSKNTYVPFHKKYCGMSRLQDGRFKALLKSLEKILRIN